MNLSKLKRKIREVYKNIDLNKEDKEKREILTVKQKNLNEELNKVISEKHKNFLNDISKSENSEFKQL